MIVTSLCKVAAYSLCRTLHKAVCRAIIQLCLFFKDLISKNLRKWIAISLSAFEKLFPLSFFDVMVHLTIRLA